MVDFFSPQERSLHMAKIGQKDSRPELALRKELHRLGLRYRLHSRNLPGTPDLVFSMFKTVVFMHGCFWHHHHGCRTAKIPKSNTAYWEAKFARNMHRDAKVKELLEKEGWHVLVVWECELNSIEKIKIISATIADMIKFQKYINE